MSTWAVLATGQSLTPAQVEKARAMPCVAVSDAYKLASWAQAMVSQDKSWWRLNPEAKKFAGRKFSTRSIEGVERVTDLALRSSHNSGLLAVHVARMLGATRVLLLGVDLHGTHYFGPHPHPLRNTVPSRFDRFKKQFANYPRGDLEIINCSPGSALACFPMASLESFL